MVNEIYEIFTSLENNYADYKNSAEYLRHLRNPPGLQMLLAILKIHKQDNNSNNYKKHQSAAIASLFCSVYSEIAFL